MRAAVIGAGASGMLAALTASELGHEVTVFERQARAGRKLMATGNGRCNLTNTLAGLRNYHGEAPDFVLPALRAFGPREAVDYFRSLGLLTREEYGGRVYPLSNSANSVVDVLRQTMDARGVRLVCGDRVRELSRRSSAYTIVTESGEKYGFDGVVVACGGLAGEKLGGGRDGYELLKALGHTRTALRPALVQITTEPQYPRSLKGIKADCRLRLLLGGGELASSEGELLFTETGVSGPAAFDISRRVSELGDAKCELELDFLRDYSEAETAAHLENRRDRCPELPASELLTGSLHNRLGRMLVKYSGLDAVKPLRELSADELGRAASACKRFRLPVKGTEGFGSAQVTAGGIRTSEFDQETLESRLCPGLFACGEVLDIDGDCGGFNLQWAWASGRLAGRLGG